MQLSTVTRRVTKPLSRVFALSAVAGLAAACSDSSLAPRSQRSTAIGQPAMSKSDGQGQFTYDPTQGITVKLGINDHKIVIPAGSVCMVGKTKYGVGTWDLPCRLEDKKQNISYKTWTDANGHPFVEFQPALRFAPGSEVLLFLADKKASMDDYSEILYCPDNKDLPCYDESFTDASLKSVRDRKGNIYRRIKHFSGYNVAAGLDEAPSARWSRSVLGGTSVAARGKKSGYMVVSGVEEEEEQPDHKPDSEKSKEQQ
jgi:hypothetical protein